MPFPVIPFLLGLGAALIHSGFKHSDESAPNPRPRPGPKPKPKPKQERDDGEWHGLSPKA